MQSKVKTGDVFQIRKHGPNYIALGRVKDNDGNVFVAATKNGNVSQKGKFKKTSIKSSPKIQILGGDKIFRVHSNREVDMDSIVRNNKKVARFIERTTYRNGVTTEASNILVQISDLISNL